MCIIVFALLCGYVVCCCAMFLFFVAYDVFVLCVCMCLAVFGVLFVRVDAHVCYYVLYVHACWYGDVCWCALFYVSYVDGVSLFIVLCFFLCVCFLFFSFFFMCCCV